MSLADDGTVVGVDSWQELDREAGVEFHAGILLPGLVNAHCHLELSCMRGAIAAGSGFVAFLRAMRQMRGQYGQEERRRALAAADARMWHEGVSAVGDIAGTECAFETKAGSRIRYRTFAEFSGLQRDSLAAVETLLCHPGSSLTPHALYSVQEAPFRTICQEGEAPLSIHFMESAEEDALFRGEGALSMWYASEGWRCDFLHYGSAVERLVASIPHDRRVILVHNCFVTQETIDRIMAHFTVPVWWCLCPGSNRYLSDLRPPVELLRANGLNICVGTDSLASNDSLSLLHELRLLGEEIPLVERLRWVTEGGAAALGLDAELGRIEVGRRAGLVLLRGLDLSAMRLLPDSTTIRLV